ncbi:hypothetical protein ACMA5I_14040 [Paracoccaceae bacterium GXU_MW_L88]
MSHEIKFVNADPERDMNRKPEIESDIRQRIDDARAQGREKAKAGNFAGMEAHMQEAWDLIPEPKKNWDYYPQSLSVAFVSLHTRLGDPAKAKQWIPTVYEMYDDADRESLYTLKIEGEALYKLELFDEAYPVFERVHELYGRDGFKGEHLQYLEFYLKERTRRDG